MRLKFLFFPIVLVISFAIFIGYIWPEIGNIKKINEEGLTKKAQLQAISEKQLAIEAIGGKISGNPEGEAFVNAYLPTTKIEERIINGVNYLAGDANLSLVNVSLRSAKGVSSQVVNVAPADPFANIDPMTGQPIQSNVNPIQNISTSISLVGDYEKIRIFLDSLQRMPNFNTINSLNIVKQQEDALAVELSVDFGYLNVAKVDNQKFENFVPSLDNDTIETLKKYISQKSQAIDSSSKPAGKTNPFLIN